MSLYGVLEMWLAGFKTDRGIFFQRLNVVEAFILNRPSWVLTKAEHSRFQEYGVNNAKIVSSDHTAGNGVIHVIDRVMFPPQGAAIDKIHDESKLRSVDCENMGINKCKNTRPKQVDNIKS